MVYSYLVFRLRQDQTAATPKMVKVLRIDKKAVASAIVELEELGLVVGEQKWYRASEPNEDQKKWFASNRRTGVPWNRQFATYPVILPKKASGLSTKTNAILWLLYSLAPKFGTPVVSRQYLAGLAAMLNMSGKGVKQGVERLITLGLIEQFGSTFFLKQPTSESLALWVDRPIRQETAFKLTSHVKVVLRQDEHDPEMARMNDDAATINEFLDSHGLMMRKAGCSEGDIIGYWRYIINHNGGLTKLWEYVVCDFEGTLNVYSEQHRANGYSGSPIKLLWLKVRERFPERNLSIRLKPGAFFRDQGAFFQVPGWIFPKQWCFFPERRVKVPSISTK